MKALCLLFSLFPLAVFVQIATAQSNKMNVQGQLTNADGTSLNGEFTVQFSIYNDSLGGTPVFTETQRLAIAESFFQTSLDVRSILFDTEYFLGLSVNGGAELTPRLPLSSSPSAFSLFGETNFIPSSGNAGFGTRRPRAPLHVVGDVLFEDLRVLPPDSLLPLLVIDTTGIIRLAQPGPFLGINCWDLNGNGIKDPEEDINGDGLHDALDCRGDEGSFDGILQSLPLIIRDNDGNVGIQLNPDGTSVHNGLERFNGGLVVPVRGVGDISISEFGVIVPMENGGGLSISEDGISMVNGDGDEVFSVDPDGSSFHAGREIFADGIINLKPLLFESALGEDLGGLVPLPSPEEDDLEAEGLWRFEEIIRAAEGLLSEGDVELDEADLRMILNNQIIGGIVILPTPEPEDLEAEGLWRFEEAVRLLDGFVSEGNNSRVNGQLSVGDLVADNLVEADVIQANTKNFRIDHPLDPSGQYLIHTSVESPDMMTVYNGNVVLDGNGAATVEMPSYFEALNKNFRYQLTAIGGPGPNLYVAEEIAGNRFKIAGGTAGMKVSWQVTGVRHDPYAKAYRSPVEVEKPAAEQGTYLHPELYGASPAQHARRDGSDQR